ncbi:MAG: hypothetical protein RLY43_1104 [Bacteroidota bacterium]
MKNMINKKTLTLIIFFLSTLYCIAQSHEPFLEQIAFDFYSTNILAKTPIKKRIKISKELNSIYYLDADCLINKIHNEKNIDKYQNSKYFDGYQLDLKAIDKKQFRKVKKINKSSNSEVFVEVSIAYEFNDRVFVVIHEFIESQGKKYTFEFDKNGNIIDWCKSSEYVQLQFE